MNRCFPTYLLLLILAILSFHLYLFAEQRGIHASSAAKFQTVQSGSAKEYSAIQPRGIGQHMGR